MTPTRFAREVSVATSSGLATISSEMKDLATRARSGKLKPEEFQGGTFSISNLGMFGIKSFASIINEPQGAIMSVGAGEQRPVVKNGQLAVATVMTVTLTCDHRVVDGAVGAKFLAAFKPLIEEEAKKIEEEKAFLKTKIDYQTAHIKEIEEVLKIGQKVEVQIKEIDPRGKVRLSMRVVDQETGEDLEGKEATEKKEEAGE